MIALGGLVQKAGLVDLTDDDRAILYGAFLTVADKLRGDEREQALTLWRRKGKRTFDMEADEKTRKSEAQSSVPPGHPASRPGEAPR
jgi:hypothetical protein